jgi:predicted outer membrane protein
MRLRNVSTILVVFAAGVSGCASSSAPREPRTPDTTTVTTTNSAEPTSKPTLTSGTVGSTNSLAAPSSTNSTQPALAHDVAPRWTDQEIIAATAAAQVSVEDDARLARDKSKSARVERFAQQLTMDQREIAAMQASIARTISGTQSEMSAKLAEARHSLSEAIRAASPASFDQAFLAAQVAYAHALIKLLDEDMIPSAKSTELKTFLQNLRAKTSTRLLQAQEIESQL